MAGLFIFLLTLILYAPPFEAWFDETHLTIAKAAGYYKWFNAAGPDMIKEKMGNREGHNHFAINPRGAIVTKQKVMAQAEKIQ